MKVIWTDNFDRETVADRLIVDGLTPEQAKAVEAELRKHCSTNGSSWYRAVSDDAVLSRGMEDFI